MSKFSKAFKSVELIAFNAPIFEEKSVYGFRFAIYIFIYLYIYKFIYLFKIN